MTKQDDNGFDFQKYRDLLLAADDLPKRLALINQLVSERAREKLAGHLISIEPTAAERFSRFADEIAREARQLGLHPRMK